jgi:hypothetical protein
VFTYLGPKDGNGNALANFTFQVQDAGTTNLAAGGQNLSAVGSITMNVAAVNDVPSFTAGPAATGKDSDKTGVAVNGWARNISKGPTDENGQAVNFLVTADNTALFSVQPSVDASGNLTFTPAPNAHGTTTVRVRLHDNGGVLNNGQDTSAEQTFQVTISKPMIWHNTLHALDVTNSAANGVDNQVAPGDALAIINYLNTPGNPANIPPGSPFGPPYLDTWNSSANTYTGDNIIAPADALAVINWINQHPSDIIGPDGEGESAALAAATGAEGEASDSFFFDMGSQAMATTTASSTPQAAATPAAAASASQQLDDVIAFLASDTAGATKKKGLLF